jgi:cell shape-determining protein MreC
MVIQTGPAPPAPASGGKKFLLFIIFILFVAVALVWANLNGYVDLPSAVTKFIPVRFLPVSDIVEKVEEAVSEYKEEEPETYEDEMATYSEEPIKTAETYEEEKYADEGGPEAFTQGHRPFFS